MMRILFCLVEAAAAGIFLVPILLVLYKVRFFSRINTAVYLLFTIYLSVMWALVGLPSAAYMRFACNLNLIPFVGMVKDMSNSILNVLLFIPLGTFLPLLWKDFQHPKQTILWGLCTSFTIELLQMLTFRATDINDLITNTLGSAIGWCIGSMLVKKLPANFQNRRRSDLWVLYGCVFVVMFFFQPFLSNAIWSLIH